MLALAVNATKFFFAIKKNDNWGSVLMVKEKGKKAKYFEILHFSLFEMLCRLTLGALLCRDGFLSRPAVNGPERMRVAGPEAGWRTSSSS
jgi:hypothetical protein